MKGIARLIGLFGAVAVLADRLPISLQDHGCPVRYRNIWVRDLEGRS